MKKNRKIEFDEQSISTEDGALMVWPTKALYPVNENRYHLITFHPNGDETGRYLTALEASKFIRANPAPNAKTQRILARQLKIVLR